MNIFVLNTGRCGSVTFIKACHHITNYSSAHESLSGKLGEARFAFPPNHIEADNRLSWVLGRLDEAYGKDALYVHLTRDRQSVARSFAKRYAFPNSIIWSYRKGMLMKLPEDADPMEVCLDYVDTVTTNINHFLKDKPKQMPFALGSAKKDFTLLWETIGAEGDLEAALAEFKVAHNASLSPGKAAAAVDKMRRVAKKFPEFLRDA